MTSIDARLTPGDAEAIFEAILRRPIDAAYRDALVAQGISQRRLIEELSGCEELGAKLAAAAPDRTALTDPVSYRCPGDLMVSACEPRRVIMIGSCMMETWAQHLQWARNGCETELYLLGAELPEVPVHAVQSYDFQVVQLPIRSLIGDMTFARLAQSDIAGHQALFEHGLSVTRWMLERAMRWNARHGLLTFVLPVPVPQQNAVGRLMPRYDLRNPVFFVEKLNEALATEIAGRVNTYFVDLNEILASHGRRFVQDDVVTQFNHGGLLSDFDFEQDQDRLEPPVRVTDLHEERIGTVVRSAWRELCAMFRTVRAADAVKLVVMDLDDTLWRGTLAETGAEALPTTEGWPLGLWEALLFLKRRGILLGIISKNDEQLVVRSWPVIFGGKLALEDFAARRINFERKSENMAAILAELHLLAGNTVYIDDNPAQRSDIAAAFPAMRVMGGNPLTWRAMLLWSAETQGVSITAESGARTAMVQAGAAREAERRQSAPQDFRNGLDVRLDLFEVTEPTHPRFARTLELLNKTNQFNTTGQRWTQEQCIAAFAGSTRFYAFDLQDRFTQYGLVGVLVVDNVSIRQFVMSCRVMGLDAEIAAVASIVDLFHRRGRRTVLATMTATDRNLPCRDVYARCGFREIIGAWQRPATPPIAIPAHVTVSGGGGGSGQA